jgi:N-acetylneuraminate synthase
MQKNKVFIIGEIGLNSNGDINLAKKIIKTAKDSGADAVKFQKRDILSCYTREELDKIRQSPFGRTNEDQKLGLEFGQKEYDEIDRYCKEIGIEWFASTWDLKSVEFLKQYNLKYNKIASARLGHIELLKAIASQQKYTFISTGMATLQEIEKAVNIFKEANCPIELMHCNSQYPMPLEDSNLTCMKTLRTYFKGQYKIGFSDHCAGILPSIIAVALGATSIEKHITWERTLYGSDQAASVEPHGFAKMIEYIRNIPNLMGDGKKVISKAEIEIRNKLWKTEDIK